MTNLKPENTDLTPEAKELIDQVYDTLMGLVGVSKYHVPMPDTDYQFVNRDAGEIYLRFGKKAYILSVREVNPLEYEDIE